MSAPPATTATASASENNTAEIRLSGAKATLPVMIYSEVSIVALVASCDRRLVGKHDIAILVNLLGRVAKEGAHWQCWPSVGTVASEVGCNPSTVNRAIGRFERLGYMERLNRYVDNRQTSNVYRFKVPAHDELPDDHPYHIAPIREIADVPGGVMHGSQEEGGTRALPRGSTRARQNAFRELPPKRTSEELRSGFEKNGEDEQELQQERTEDKDRDYMKSAAKEFERQRDRRLAMKGERISLRAE